MATTVDSWSLPEAEADQSFGAQLYEAFCTAGRLEFLTSRLNYEEIQRLKQADREQLLIMCQGAPSVFLQRLKSDTPQQLVDRFVELGRRNAVAFVATVFPFYMVGFSIFFLRPMLPLIGPIFSILAYVVGLWLTVRYMKTSYRRPFANRGRPLANYE